MVLVLVPTLISWRSKYEVYNKVILEKAILNKELQDASKNKFTERVKQLIPHKKTLICDYFKESYDILGIKTDDEK